MINVITFICLYQPLTALINFYVLCIPFSLFLEPRALLKFENDFQPERFNFGIKYDAFVIVRLSIMINSKIIEVNEKVM